jgi:hypothetical protein
MRAIDSVDKQIVNKCKQFEWDRWKLIYNDYFHFYGNETV